MCGKSVRELGQKSHDPPLKTGVWGFLKKRVDIPNGFSIQRFKWKNRKVAQLTLRAFDDPDRDSAESMQSTKVPAR